MRLAIGTAPDGHYGRAGVRGERESPAPLPPAFAGKMQAGALLLDHVPRRPSCNTRMPLLLHMQRICSKTRLVPGAGRSRSNYSAGSEFLLQRPAEIPSEQGIFRDLTGNSFLLQNAGLPAKSEQVHCNAISGSLLRQRICSQPTQRGYVQPLLQAGGDGRYPRGGYPSY